ncbi:hypothetical protein CEXT_171371 [Caerostris extrusa]|uniref:Uncharacterized protein n=1 Tax=Caerostris extrusa TaxID=172846 RepID=A0AAV4Y4Q8_CAEEX|nr:hypothetical protein CEXT_171371 [Caerostris extrusa]
MRKVWLHDDYSCCISAQKWIFSRLLHCDSLPSRVAHRRHAMSFFLRKWIFLHTLIAHFPFFGHLFNQFKHPGWFCVRGGPHNFSITVWQHCSAQRQWTAVVQLGNRPDSEEGNFRHPTEFL